MNEFHIPNPDELEDLVHKKSHNKSVLLSSNPPIVLFNPLQTITNLSKKNSSGAIVEQKSVNSSVPNQQTQVNKSVNLSENSSGAMVVYHNKVALNQQNQVNSSGAIVGHKSLNKVALTKQKPVNSSVAIVGHKSLNQVALTQQKPANELVMKDIEFWRKVLEDAAKKEENKRKAQTKKEYQELYTSIYKYINEINNKTKIIEKNRVTKYLKSLVKHIQRLPVEFQIELKTEIIKKFNKLSKDDTEKEILKLFLDENL
jgi:hypothetical protein